MLAALRLQAARSFPRQLPVTRAISRPRFISSSRPLRAAEGAPPPLDPSAVEALKNSSVYQQISTSPEAIEAVRKFGMVISSKNIDLSSGKPLSMLQMSKLMLDSEFRQAAKDLMEGLQKAGVDLNSKNVMEEFARLGKVIGGPKP